MEKITSEDYITISDCPPFLTAESMSRMIVIKPAIRDTQSLLWHKDFLCIIIERGLLLLGQYDLIYLLENPELIPENWRGTVENPIHIHFYGHLYKEEPGSKRIWNYYLYWSDTANKWVFGKCYQDGDISWHPNTVFASIEPG